MKPPIYVDGRPVSAVSARDRGLQFGDGVFETIAVRDGRLRLAERHFARLHAGLERLAIRFDQGEALRDELETLARRTVEGVLKVIVTRGSGTRGYGAPAHARARRIVYLSPWPQLPPMLRLVVCGTRLASGGSLAGIKHLNRLEQVLARLEVDAQPAADDGLMLDAEGHVIETTNANVFIVNERRIRTSSLARCGVAGVMRAAVMDRLRATGVECEETDLTLDHLHTADEVFVTNSLGVITPVVALENTTWPVGTQTRALRADLHAWLASEAAC